MVSQQQLRDEMPVKLTVDGIIIHTTLSSFFKDNEFTQTEKKHIRGALLARKAYYGGGGAMVQWKLEEADR